MKYSVAVGVVLVPTLLVLGCDRPAAPAPPAAPFTGGLAIAATAALTGETPKSAPTDWPWWRGPAGNGHASGGEPAPTSWAEWENILWKTPVPGRGHASPVIWGKRIYLATADKDELKQYLVAYDRGSGDEVWKTRIHDGGFMRVHDKNSYASATPACDGERVYCAFLHDNAQWITAVNVDGSIAWQENVGPFTSEHGDGPSPVLYRSTVIINGDGSQESYVVAADRKTGKVVWRTPRLGGGMHGNYGAPILAHLAGKPQLLVTGHTVTASYNPDDGKLIWSCRGPAEVAGNTVAFSEKDDLVFASAGFPEHEVLAVRADGSGDVTETHVAWRSNKSPAYVPSPLHHDGRVYVISDQGVATCFSALDGKKVWQKRLGGAFSASPVLAGDAIYAISESGEAYVFRPGDKYEQIARNSIGEGVMATPAIAGGRIYLRTDSNLYCIGEKP